MGEYYHVADESANRAPAHNQGRRLGGSMTTTSMLRPSVAAALSAHNRIAAAAAARTVAPTRSSPAKQEAGRGNTAEIHVVDLVDSDEDNHLA